MNSDLIGSESYSAWRNNAGPGVIAFGMWLRVGFIGASAVAVALIQLFSGEAKPLSALGLAAAGLVLALFSWRRARTALDGVDGASVAEMLAQRPRPESPPANVGAAIQL